MIVGSDVSSDSMERNQPINTDLATYLAIIFGAVLLVLIIVSVIVYPLYRRNVKLPRTERQLDLPLSHYNVKKVDGDYTSYRYACVTTSYVKTVIVMLVFNTDCC